MTGFSDHRIARIAKLGKQLESEMDFNKKLINAINTSREGIALLDQDGNYTWMNESHEKMFGYSKDELIGKSWTILYSKSDVDHFIETVFPEIEKHGFWRGEAIAIAKDGKTKIHEDLSLTSLDDGGLICTCRDKNK